MSMSRSSGAVSRENVNRRAAAGAGVQFCARLNSFSYLTPFFCNSARIWGQRPAGQPGHVPPCFKAPVRRVQERENASLEVVVRCDYKGLCIINIIDLLYCPSTQSTASRAARSPTQVRTPRQIQCQLRLKSPNESDTAAAGRLRLAGLQNERSSYLHTDFRLVHGRRLCRSRAANAARGRA